MPRRLRNAALAVALVVTAAAGACGDDEPAYCQDLATAQDSFEQLTDVDVRADGVSSLTAGLDEVQTSLTALADSASEEFGSEADALRSAVSTLGTELEATGASPSREGLAAISASLTQVQTTFNALVDSVGSSC